MTASLDRLSLSVPGAEPYFSLSFQMSAKARRQLALPPAPVDASRVYRLRRVAHRLGQLHADPACTAGRLEMLAVFSGVLRWLAYRYLQSRNCEVATESIMIGRQTVQLPGLRRCQETFVDLYPPDMVYSGMKSQVFLYGPFGEKGRTQTLIELLVLSIQTANPAATAFRQLYDDVELSRRIAYRATLQALDGSLRQGGGSGFLGMPLLELLQAPVKASPDSLEGQLHYVRKHWQELLPDALLLAIDAGLALRSEETRMRGGGPGPQAMPDYSALPLTEEERFSPDSDWMSDLVLLAKSVHVWLDQLSRQYGRFIKRLDEIPDEELDVLARRGFTGLWLIGIWKRSPASRQIKRLCGNAEAEASAYALYDYAVAEEFGGQDGVNDLDRRCRQRGIRLACDVVPNHTGIDSRWMREHPDWFVRASYPPYPGYRFTGPDLSTDGGMSLYLEDGYWDHSDAAVVFKRVDRHSGAVHYIYHGNDGTHLPWNDTAQLNFLLPQVREAMIRTIVEVARTFRVIRFDAAMTLAKKHYQRLWFPLPGGGAGVPSRSEYSMSSEEFERLFPLEFWREVVDRVTAEVPDTLLLAEAFWLMESYFVRTLGMHRVYNSAFMHMMKHEDNAKFRQLLKKTLAFNPEILKRFVNFMNNPDEATAVEQFGKGDKYFGVAVLLATLPGLPMFGHGQVEGFREKYGMEYRRAYLQEDVDRGFVEHHEKMIFPLLHRRFLFSGARYFELYDFISNGQVVEDVLAYSNRWGEQRALVVYHNRPLQTGGWVRKTCPRGEEGAVQDEKPLSRALDLQVGENIFYRFRDHCSDVHYLRSSHELTEQGLFVTLGPYQAHVFLDFAAVTDTDGCWRQLWQKLGGQPVADLDREYRRLFHAGVLQALNQVLKAGADFFRLGDGGCARVVRIYGEFLQILQRDLHLGGDIERLTDCLQQQLQTVKGLEEEIAGDIREILWPWLVLLSLERLSHGGAEPVPVADWLDRYPFEEVLMGRWPEDVAVENMQLLRLLLRHRTCGCLEREHWLKRLFDDDDVRAFLLVHRYQDCNWFSRERFERLVNGLMTTAVLEKQDSARQWFERCRHKIVLILARAEQTGYRLDKFLTLV